MTFAQIRQYVVGLLRASFTNKAELDKIGEDSNGNLTYNGSAISGGSGSGETITNQDIETAITEDAASIWAEEEQEEEPSEEPGE
jgi:hypothetical protein